MPPSRCPPPGGAYRLGLKLVALSDRVLGQLDVRERARPWLIWLVQETGETATLSLPGGGQAITIDFVPSPSSVVSLARLGRPSVFCGRCGNVACAPRRLLARLISTRVSSRRERGH